MRPPRLIPVLGLAGCVILAFALPCTSVLAAGALAYLLRRLGCVGAKRLAQCRETNAAHFPSASFAIPCRVPLTPIDYTWTPDYVSC